MLARKKHKEAKVHFAKYCMLRGMYRFTRKDTIRNMHVRELTGSLYSRETRNAI